MEPLLDPITRQILLDIYSYVLLLFLILPRGCDGSGPPSVVERVGVSRQR
jgi:hypothetical protein